MKKLLSLFVVLFASLPTFAEVTGTGTSDDPFIITETCTVTNVPASTIYEQENVYFTVTSSVNATVSIDATAALGWNTCQVAGKTICEGSYTNATFEATAQTPYTVFLYINYESSIKFTFTETTGINNATVNSRKSGKFLQNGQLVILKDGKQFNAAGQLLK